ncbi:SusC/RagA family TonB-linked outer membrane protein [Pedobacter sp. SYSU D00535]|uniref:SusC/RagA family TonB-linked outer membrane protein n=1 Tax=Pedobacter sp. SYSU D00535 TaxID=2810308 RepID=UPI001A965E45|nr:SusC/RagA family TonB-linked outer membrane protein [Pedobacter sp. SYSU D00535]
MNSIVKKGKYLRQAALVLVMFISCLRAGAQTQSLSGTVTDEEGLTLPGVSVSIQGTTLVTSTNAEGKFTLRLEKALTTSDNIIFKYLGFQTLTLPYSGSNTISVKMKEDSQKLNEVVVTALGIKREEKALGYAIQNIDSEQLNDARSNNWISALSGKVAGLTLISPGSGPVNSTRVTLRGNTSLNTDGNFALIVLDGVPVNSGMTSSGVDNAYGAGSGNDVPIDFGNGISDINPDDIESITVLKGASATALYGNRAANGALIITTKSGKRRDKGLGVTVNSNVSFNDVLKWPDFQYEYGQGTMTAQQGLIPASQKYYSYGNSADGAGNSGTSSAFGPRFNGQMYYQYDPTVQGQSPERRLWQPYKDNVTGFFRTGSTITNSVALEGGSEKASARASITHSKNEWIMPNTGYQRLNAALSLSYDISDKIKLNSKVNFSNKSSDNLPATGYNNQSMSYFMIFQNPNVDLSWYEPRWKNGLNQIDQIHPFSSFIDNPYLIAYEMTNAVDNNKAVGNISAHLDLTPKLNLMIRTALDYSTEDRDTRRPYSTANFQRGYYKQQNIYNYELNNDALLTYKTNINTAFNFSATVGGNLRTQRYRGLDRSVDGLVTPGVYKLANGINTPLSKSNYWNKQVNSVYGIASFDYKSKIFLDLTGRNDWSSTLPVNNNSFFYPSASASFILNELIRLPEQVSYAKLRLSAAQAGNDTDAYKTSKYYGISDFPSSAVAPTTLHNADFKPELTTSYEGGLELNLFGNRLGADITLYENTTENQILDVPLDPTTGYTRAVLNAGTVRNRGIELMLRARPIDTKNFKWNTSINWAKNDNKVLELAEGMTDRQDIGYGGNATLQARVGGSTGDIYGFGFVRSPEGEIVYTAAGLPARPAEIQRIGNAYADWKGGFFNEFSYKAFRFNFLLDGQYGGIIYSQTHHKMSEQGKLKHTLPGREEGYIIGKGVVLNADGTYSPNTTKVAVGDYYGDYYRRANVESNSFDASFLKLREVRFEYTLPKSLTSKIRVNGASLAVYGRDLAMITNFPMFDPETAALNGSTLLPGIEMGQLPSTRTFGMNLTLRF